MTDTFRHKYRIPSARLQSWDYGRNGYYFVTLCTQNRQHFFDKPNHVHGIIVMEKKNNECDDNHNGDATKNNRGGFAGNDKSYHTPSQYIINNPLKWDNDKLNSLSTGLKV